MTRLSLSAQIQSKGLRYTSRWRLEHSVRQLLLLFFVFLACSAQGQSFDARLKLSNELSELMQVRTMFEASIKHCKEPEGSSFDPKTEFSANPGSFGGVSPQSAYWPEVEAIYTRLLATSCAYATTDKFAAYYSQQIAQRSTEEDLQAAIAYLSSPAGRRLQSASVQVNESYQKFAQQLMAQSYGSAREQYQIDIRALLRKYQKEPR
jgi:hypothetical protein